MGLEIVEQTPDLDAVIVPVGGGGLLAGVGTVIKALKPSARVVGVEPVHAACFTAALAAGRPVSVALSPTLADGLAVALLGTRPFETLQNVVDEVVTVDEASIALAILRLIELEKSVVEGAGAAPLAAFLRGQRSTSLKGKRVVLALCGGNIDLHRARPRDRSRARRRRPSQPIHRLHCGPAGRTRTARRGDRLDRGVDQGDRARPRVLGPDLSAVRVACIVETTGHDHVRELHAALAKSGMAVVG